MLDKATHITMQETRGMRVFSLKNKTTHLRGLAVVLIANWEYLGAGAIQAANNSNLAILNSTFLNNIGLSAGAIGILNSSLFVNGSTFQNNTGQQVSVLESE